jgi:DNA (cytosine-5)-methyltransferase 1
MTTIGSLFSGVGLLELGLEWAGLGPVVWQVEKDPFCREILTKHWPNVERHNDVCIASGLSRVDLICGGFPCQDISGAGKGAGLDGARSGLWREFRRIVTECRPRFIVVENVESGASKWLPQVMADLEGLEYRTRALGIAARDVGVPHKRSRVFVVADSDSRGLASVGGGRQLDAGEREARGHDVDRRGDSVREEERWRAAAQPGMDRGAHGGAGWVDGDPSAPKVAIRSARWPAGKGERQHEWESPRGARGLYRQRERLAALGNGVAPQCAEIVGHVIQQILRAP